MTSWAVLTGEYPPQVGGVSDYTRLVCHGLVNAGDRVMVFAPDDGTFADDVTVSVFRLPDHFGRRGRAIVEDWLRVAKPDRVLIQYVPHALGWKAMNVPFAWWVRYRLARLAPVWVTFHEVTYPFVRRPWHHNLIAVANRLMARLVADAAERLFVTIPAWGDLLRTIAPGSRPAEWLPVPSNLPITTDLSTVAAVRRLLPQGLIIGHFGTYGQSVANLLESTLAMTLRAFPNRLALLIGRNGMGFRDRMMTRHPDLASHLVTTGDLPPDAVANYLAVCDLVLQPYPDGVSCRRTSVMSSLALGKPVVSNLGQLSEPIWASEKSGVFLATNPDPDELATEVERALALSEDELLARGNSGRSWYSDRFDVTRVVAHLRGGAS